MASNAARKRVEQAETEIAVLQTQFRNLDEKVDELKVDLKEMNQGLEQHMSETKAMIHDFQQSNKTSHEEIAKKISDMEKIKWMLMGAAAVLGATGAQAFKMFIERLQ